MGLRIRRPFQIITEVIGTALANIFGKTYETDSILLGNGVHEIEIETDGMVSRVWVSFDNEEDYAQLPICHGNIDKVGVMRTEEGFILFADIASTSRRVRWFSSTDERREAREFRLRREAYNAFQAREKEKREAKAAKEKAAQEAKEAREKAREEAREKEDKKKNKKDR